MIITLVKTRSGTQLCWSLFSSSPFCPPRCPPLLLYAPFFAPVCCRAARRAYVNITLTLHLFHVQTRVWHDSAPRGAGKHAPLRPEGRAQQAGDRGRQITHQKKNSERPENGDREEWKERKTTANVKQTRWQAGERKMVETQRERERL